MRRRNQRKQAIYRPAFGRRYRALATPSSTAPSEILQIYSNEVNENMPVEHRSAKPSSASRPAQTAPRSGAPRRNVPLGHFIEQQQHITHLAKSSTPRNCTQSDHRRGYDDDEPLLSPTDGGRCVPIPEVEDEDGEVEKFQGFVNPLSSSSGESAFNCGDSKNAEVSLMPEATVMTVGRSHHAYAVVLRVKAPLPWSLPRQPAHGNNSTHFMNPSRRAPFDLLTLLYQCYICQMPLHCYADVGNSQNALGVNYGVAGFTSTSPWHYLNFILQS
ncbi:hypothetical protein U1Q18_044280 [Sarracenia purpurea var. burkii]